MTLKNIARYEIESEIGRGGMAVVYLAHDPNFRRKVAIKLVSGTLQEVATIRERFEREAHLIARIEHPAIVPVYDFGEQDNRLYLVMRYMQGGSLASRLKAERLSLPSAVQILAQIAPALDAVHAQGIVHRDLKPGNILLDGFGNPAISDFGIAHFTAATTDLTGSAIIGTPAYMSPEQVRAEDVLDGRSDIYAMGVILFEMLTGRGPFHANTPMSVALKHLTDPIPSIRTLRPDLPEGLDSILNKAMAKDRELRYGTVSTMVEDLQAMLEESKVTPVPRAAGDLPTEVYEFHESGISPPSSSTPTSGTGPLKSTGPLPQRSSRNLLRVALASGLGIALFLLCGSLGAFGTWAGLSGFFARESPTPQPTQEVTPTAGVQDVVLFADDFSDPNSGWPSGQDAQGQYGYLSGGYHILVNAAGAVLWASTDRVNDNLGLFVDARTVSNSQNGYYGLLCRIQDEQNFYYFVIKDNGEYTIGKYRNAEFHSLFPEGWRQSSAILTGGQTNRLQADCEGNTLRLHVNDTLLDQATDSDLTFGFNGLVAASLDGQIYEVVFDNFLTTKPDE